MHYFFNIPSRFVGDFFMFRATTVIELLVTLSIMLIAVYFISPIWFGLQDRILVENEVENLKSFLYQIQDKARYHNQNYALTLAQENSNWCIIAIAKKDEKSTACNCLNLKSCLLTENHYLLYRNIMDVSVYNRRFYPSIFTHFDGKSGNQSTICLNISKGKHQSVLQIQRNGVINVLDVKSRTQCKESD